jgi:aminoglycoside phosphotransferase
MSWWHLPAALRLRVESLLGEQILDAESQRGGFSRGSADRVVGADGGRAFVKTIGRREHPQAFALHRRELAVMRQLPDSVGAPRLLGSVDDGDWVALVLEDVSGRHAGDDATESDVLAVLAAVEAMPVLRSAGEAPTLPEAHVQLAEHFEGWARIRADGDSQLVPTWAREHLAELEALAARGAEAVRGDHLVHLDLRDDNVLIDGSGAARIVDWPWAGVGARWFDGLTYLLDTRLRGVPVDTERVLATHELFAAAPEADIDAVLAGLAGNFFDVARRPAPAGLPSLRAFQREEASAALSWLRDRAAARGGRPL